MPLVAQNATHRVILGLMTFGPDEATGARITSVDEFGKVLDIFQKRGYHEVDTARMYIGGKQEAFTRDVGWKQRGLTLATKVEYPAEPGSNTPDKVKASVELSLKELGADCVDLLYLHAADRGTPFVDTLRAINELHKAGKFVNFGISNFAAYEVAEIVMICVQNNWVRPTVYQAMYNVITRSIESELLPACRRYGLDVVVYNPIAGGLFSGKIKSKDMVPAEGRFSDSTTRIGKMYRNRYFKESTFKALQTIEAAVEKHNLTMIETALRWTMHHSALNVTNGGRDGIIIGVSSGAQLEDNLDHLEKGPLPDEVIKSLDEAWAIARADTPNYYHMELKYHYDTKQAVFGNM